MDKLCSQNKFLQKHNRQDLRQFNFSELPFSHVPPLQHNLVVQEALDALQHPTVLKNVKWSTFFPQAN